MPQIKQNQSSGTRPAPAGNVTVRGRESVSVTGVEEVESFDEESVVMTTSDGALTIDGTGLNVTKLDLTGGEVAIEGRFIGMYYAEPRKKAGRRLFGRG